MKTRTKERGERVAVYELSGGVEDEGGLVGVGDILADGD